MRPTYGPHNPHPLSQMRTELVWEGKYDEYGRPRDDLEQPPHLGRQQAHDGVAAEGVQGKDRPDLRRPAVRCGGRVQDMMPA